VDSIAPIDQSGDEVQAGEEVSGELVVSGGDGSEILDAAIGAFDDVAPFVAFGIEEEGALAIGFVGDDGDGAAAIEQGAQMIGVIALVADQPGAGCDVAQQRRCEGDVGDVAAAQAEGERPAGMIDQGVDFGRAPTARAADGLAAFPPFAPLAARWARTAVLSIIATPGGSAHPASAAKTSCHRPRLLHRLYRLNTVVYGPYSAGKARQRQPSRRRCTMPLMMRRSSCRTGPVCTIGRCGAIAAHCPSLSQKLSGMIQAPPGA
jgi:hypothetical protein